jgi:pimeloyl-ACP methyl ester carboxylesterase
MARSGTENSVIGDLHTEISGRGPPVLLIHGFGASSVTWSKIIAPLTADHTVIAVDLKGFGRSKKPRDGGYSLRHQAAAVMQVVTALDLRDLTLVGHSMGGGVALLAAMSLEREVPTRLRRIVLIDSIALPQRIPFFLTLLRLPVVGPLVVRLMPPRWGVRCILNIAYCDPAKIEPALVEAYAAALRCADGRAALIATARAMIPADVERLIEQYRRLRTPVLLIWGREDRIVPVCVAVRLKEMIPAVLLRVIDQCGHVPQEELPDQTVTAILWFLASSSSPERSTGDERPPGTTPERR